LTRTESKTALDRCIARVLARLNAADLEATDRFLSELRGISGGEVPLASAEWHAHALPVLRHWPKALAGAAGIDRELAAALAELSPSFAWRQNPNYVRRPPSPEFLSGYGYAVIAGPGGLAPAGIAVGVLLLAPGLTYPAHAHPAEEIYLVLDAASRWQRAGEPWREGIGGAAIHHPPRVAHAMQAGEAPLCAIYLWRGDLVVDASLTE
jgi:quercetin dioxygenase-like cupin family protein